MMEYRNHCQNYNSPTKSSKLLKCDDLNIEYKADTAAKLLPRHSDTSFPHKLTCFLLPYSPF